jgi:hypothetical protein
MAAAEDICVPAVPLNHTTFGFVVSATFQTLVVFWVHPEERRLEPLMIGCAPVPYDANVIGLPALPLCPGIRLSRHVPPALNPTDCPGVSVVALTFAMVCQAVAGVVPLLELLPALST